MILSEDDIRYWQTWVGRTAARDERLDPAALRRFGSALGEAGQPSLAHWAFFLPDIPVDELDVDGHRKRGGFLPPVTLPRRMFAAATMQFRAPLLIDEQATQTATIRSVTRKSGHAGELVLVEVENRILQRDLLRIVEVQTIIYRDEGPATPPVAPAPFTVREEDMVWHPSTVELFRFSAVTFNAHRIHYDQTYATSAEGYPGLVVHGPLTAARLFSLAYRQGQPTGFAFRAMAPLFQGQPILLRAGSAPGTFEAVRCDAAVAMQASATYG
ncbi:hypothetical protein C1T17_06455 [Sphingobium sp. SCG-1]|uniref:FAS1-like dehydratase domain-containing protein n=1 Tax=Sphingobium sp. SCG-1 TaxID=2072936 RepID=UPI000CD6C504|nr:MaoC/PaaZ C-terminal domain-containing protein [Sphingobium sp. SCG-1]AUW57800.1 hypothetical protein C1T17_06455 [Sphingobium sp. SCG-1]